MVDSGAGAVAFEDKLACFQAITGLDDPDLCTDILSAHDWDLELAISSFTASSFPSSSSSAPAAADDATPASHRASGLPAGNVGSPSDRDLVQAQPPAAPGLVWRLVTLPFYVVSGGAGLISGAVGLGAWIAGGVISRSLGLVGLLPPPRTNDGSSSLIPPPSAVAGEAAAFVAAFDREFGGAGAVGPNFVAEGFMDALQRSTREFKLLFVYLHSPDHPDVPDFCSGCLCSEVVADFVNANFVSWGGSIRSGEGFKMGNSLKASRFPFCAVVMADTNQRIALLQQIEGPKSPEELLTILQRVNEEISMTLVTARLEAEERRNALRLREEQDAAYQAALEADQARERQRKEKQEMLEREAAEAERKHKEEEEAKEMEAREAAEKEATLSRRRQEKAMLLGVEPEKGPDVTHVIPCKLKLVDLLYQVLVRFPTGERKERRFHNSASVESLYDYVDSLDCLKADTYRLVSNFPRVAYGPDKLSLTVKEAGLHPQASLFVEVES